MFTDVVDSGVVRHIVHYPGRNSVSLTTIATLDNLLKEMLSHLRLLALTYMMSGTYTKSNRGGCQGHQTDGTAVCPAL